MRNDCVFHSGYLAVGYERQEKCCGELKSRQPGRDQMLQVKLQAIMSFMRQQSQIFRVQCYLGLPEVFNPGAHLVFIS